MNNNEIEFTQWRVLAGVKPSPSKTCPKWPPHCEQVISVRIPSASKLRLTAPGISLSKLGQPQRASNLFTEWYSGWWHWRQTKVPISFMVSYSPLNGASVPLSIITLFSSGVSGYNRISLIIYSPGRHAKRESLLEQANLLSCGRGVF